MAYRRPEDPRPQKPKRSKKSDAWSKNDEKLYKIMGGKSKTRYEEDQATYREFGRTYGGPTDAASVAMRKRREAGNWSFGEKPKQANRRGLSKDKGKPLQISPVGTSRTQGYSRTKPTSIPKGYTLLTYMSSPPKYKLVKNAPKTSPRGRGKNPSVAPSRYAAQQKKSIRKRSK